MDVFVAGDYAYVADGDSGLQIVNVSDRRTPTLARNFRTAAEAQDVFVAGDYAFVTNWYSYPNLQIVNVTDPRNPTLAASYGTPGCAEDVFVTGEFVYVADLASLMILRFNPQDANEPAALLPQVLRLAQNYPNPFNAMTALSYASPRTGSVELSIFNLLGERVTVLFQGTQAAGEHHAIWDASRFPSGAYLARLKAGASSQTVKMILLKCK